jgi:hypothetical protein
MMKREYFQNYSQTYGPFDLYGARYNDKWRRIFAVRRAHVVKRDIYISTGEIG